MFAPVGHLEKPANGMKAEWPVCLSCEAGHHRFHRSSAGMDLCGSAAWYSLEVRTEGPDHSDLI